MQRTTLVTGATSGIGKEFAYLLAESGENLLLTGRNETELQRISKELTNKHNISIHILAVDLSQKDSPKALFEYANSNNLFINKLINNAGFGTTGKFEDSELAEQLNMIQVNISSLVALTHLFLPKMHEMNEGQILNVASTASFMPGPNMAVYFATKAFVRSFTEAIALELSSTNIKVSCLCPGITSSAFFKHPNSQIPSKLSQTRPMTPNEVAKAGLKAFNKGKLIEIPGIQNKMLISLIKVLPNFLKLKLIKSVLGD